MKLGAVYWALGVYMLVRFDGLWDLTALLLLISGTIRVSESLQRAGALRDAPKSLQTHRLTPAEMLPLLGVETADELPDGIEIVEDGIIRATCDCGSSTVDPMDHAHSCPIASVAREFRGEPM